MAWTQSVIFLAILAFGVGTTAACSNDAPSAETAASAQRAPAELGTQEVALVGQNYCLGCALKKGEGAAAQCSEYGHRHALEVESAVGPDGQPIPQLAGRTIHYLDNDQSAPLVSGEALHGKRVEIQGRLFGPRSTLEVREVREKQ